MKNILQEVFGRSKEREGASVHWRESKPSVPNAMQRTVEMWSLQNSAAPEWNSSTSFSPWDSILQARTAQSLARCEKVCMVEIDCIAVYGSWTWRDVVIFIIVCKCFLNCLSWIYWHLSLSERNISNCLSMVTQNVPPILQLKPYKLNNLFDCINTLHVLCQICWHLAMPDQKAWVTDNIEGLL